MNWNSYFTRTMSRNLFSAEVRENPYPYYAALRHEAPVDWTEHGNFYVVARYADVRYVLQHPEIFSSSVMASADSTLLGTNPPAHTRVRKIINPCFSARRLARLETRIREVTTQLVERVAPYGTCDLMSDIAAPLPVTIIAEMLGVDATHLDDFKRWSDAIIVGATGMVSTEQRRNITRSAEEFRAFFAHAIVEHQQDQARTHSYGDDIICTLTCSDESSAHETLTTDEALSLTMLLLIAGNETTTNLIGNTMLALLSHPAEMEKVLNNHALIPAAVEETLRYDSPLQHLRRQTTRDVVLSNTLIPAQSLVIPLLGSANRDEDHFSHPEQFDISRNRQGQAAFGFGAHVCLGAPLARLETKIALEVVLSHLHHLRLKNEPITHVNSIQVRGPGKLSLLFDPT